MKTSNRDTGRLFLREELSKELEQAFSKHVASCECCRSWLEEDSGDQRTWDLARELDVTDAGVDTLSKESRCTTSLEQVAAQVRPYLAPTDDPSMMGRIGPYEIIGVVGRGGMGIVLKAYERSLDRNVALKMLDPALTTTGAARKRFAREANAMASVSHPNVVPIFAVDEHRDIPYFAMEYVVGETLDSRIRRDGPLDSESAVRITLQISEALSAAHSQGLVHRDIKPANILLDQGTDRVRVADFGLARVASESSHTRTGVVAGTPQYMSPEQVQGKSCDGSSDLFSLGTVLYAMACAHPPFRAESIYGVMQRIVHDQARSLRIQNPRVPVWLEGLTNRLMEKEPEKRFESAAHLAAILRDELAYLQDPSRARQPARNWLPASPGSTHEVARPIGFAIIGLVLALFLWRWFPVDFIPFAQVATETNRAQGVGPAQTPNAVPTDAATNDQPDVKAVLDKYEASLAPYNCFHAKWMTKWSWGYVGEVEAQRTETLSYWRDGDRLRSVEMRVANHADSARPIGSYYEFIHDRPDRSLTIEPSGRVYCNTSVAFDFESGVAGQLHRAPTSATFGLLSNKTPLLKHIRDSNPKLSSSTLDGREVFEIRAVNEIADITIWIDPKLNYAARRIRSKMLKRPTQSGKTVAYTSLPTTEFHGSEFEKHGETFVPTMARLSSITPKRKDEAESHVYRDYTLVSIDFRKQLVAADLQPMKPIQNGTPVTFNNQILPPTHHYWQDGEAVVDESKVAKPTPRKSQPVECFVEGNLAHRKPTKASSEEQNQANVSNLAVDGDISTRWCAAGGAAGQWWQVDLEEPRQIKSVRMHWEKTGTTYLYKVLTSLDGEEWSLVVDRSTDDKVVEGAVCEHSPFGKSKVGIKARYLRIQFEGNAHGVWASLREVEVSDGKLRPMSQGADRAWSEVKEGARVGDLFGLNGFDFENDDDNELDDNASDELDTQAILAKYEESLSAYDCFHGEWLVKELYGPEGKERPTGNSDAISLWRQGKHFRWTKTRVANNSESSPQPVGSYYEHIHDRRGRLLSIEPGGKLFCKSSDAVDFQHVVDDSLGMVPSSASFGVEQFPLATFLRHVDSNVEKEDINGHEVFAVHGQDEHASVSVWLDPNLNYAARRVRCEMLTEPVRPGSENSLAPGHYLFPIFEYEAKQFSKRGDIYVPSQARWSMAKRSAPGMVVVRDIRLLDVDFATEPSEVDLMPTTPIRNGTAVRMSGADASLRHFWINGEVVHDNGDKGERLFAAKAQFKSFRIQPIATELQRFTSLGRSDVFAVIDGDALLTRGCFHENDIDLTLLADMLQLQRSTTKKLDITLRWSKYEPSDTEVEKIKGTIKTVCESAGYHRVRITDRTKSGEWSEFAKQFDEQRPEAKEQKTDHEAAQVFPVRTVLSRSMLGDDVDCFVFMRQPFDGRFDGFSKGDSGALGECIHDLGLEQRRRIIVGGHYTSSGSKAFFRFFENKGDEPSPADEFAQRLGFESCGWSFAIPMGLSPENLIGNRAPDFTLSTLDGTEFNLHESIKNRVAVIAFWGVACGGCRIEAPHLSALHEKYKDRGLTVIGINGYDESNDIVTDYVDNADLTHTILMEGGSVATDRYTVRSYPVTFLVNHEGLVVDYHLGFDEGDEKWLEQSVKRLLSRVARPR